VPLLGIVPHDAAGGAEAAARHLQLPDATHFAP